MNPTLAAVWAGAAGLGVGSFGVGVIVSRSDHPSLRLVAGWSVFFLICAFAWILGIPGDVARSAIWLFAACGLGACLWRRQWRELGALLLCTAGVGLVLAAPYLTRPQLAAYGTYGTDMWGYISTSEWVRHHSIHELPVPGAPMRYNWVWHVLREQERPLIYSALACFGSAAGITPIQAYLALPVALISGLAAMLTLTLAASGWRRAAWTVPLALLVSLHPLILVHWILQFYSGVIVAGCMALAVAALLAPSTGRVRAEALALVLLMLALCAALYARQFVWVGLALAGLPALSELYPHRGDPELRRQARQPAAWMFWMAAAWVVAGSVLLFTPASASELPGPAPVGDRLAEGLTLFGGASPLPWFAFDGVDPAAYRPPSNPVGWAMAVGFLGLLGWFAWTRWRASKDLSIPVLLAVATGCVGLAAGSHFALSRVLPVFGPPFLVGLTVLASRLRNSWQALAVTLFCGLPLLRSGGEVVQLLAKPDYLLETTATAEPQDWDQWGTLGYLHLHEDAKGFDWAKHPSGYFAITHFLPDHHRARIATQLGLPLATEQH